MLRRHEVRETDRCTITLQAPCWLVHSRVRRTWYNEADSVHLCLCAGTVSEAMPAHVATPESFFRAACSWSL